MQGTFPLAGAVMPQDPYPSCLVLYNPLAPATLHNDDIHHHFATAQDKRHIKFS